MMRKPRTELDAVDKELIRMKLADPALSQTELGATLSLHPRAVGKRLNNPMFKKEMAKLQNTVINLIQVAKQKAIRKLIKLIDSKEDSVAARVCIRFLADVLPEEGMTIKYPDGVPQTYIFGDKVIHF